MKKYGGRESTDLNDSDACYNCCHYVHSCRKAISLHIFALLYLLSSARLEPWVESATAAALLCVRVEEGAVLQPLFTSHRQNPQLPEVPVYRLPLFSKIH